jgi:hypothetical protein
VSQHDRRLPRRYVWKKTYRFAGLYPVAGVQSEYEPPADAVVSLRMADGGEASLQLQHMQARRVLAAVAWRKTRSARGQAHYPGYFWSATMGGHVIYESRLELARLLLADFDRDVAAIAAQPFLLQARVAGMARRHMPDFLLAHANGSVRVVNVKPAGKLAEPQTAEALAWPGQPIFCMSRMISRRSLRLMVALAWP